MLKELQEIISLREEEKVAPKYFIGVDESDIAGMENPLWTILNSYIPPPRPWTRVRGAERAQIRRAADLLRAQKIPFTFYADFIKKFHKTHLKHFSALPITAIKEKETGTTTFLSDFVTTINTLIPIFQENPAIIYILDSLYTKYPAAYRQGVYRYIFAAGLIKDYLKNKYASDALKIISHCSSLITTLEELGKEAKPVEIKFTKGVQVSSDHLKLLQKEKRIRKGEEPGTPNPALNKYFKSSGAINTRSLETLAWK